MVRLQRAGGTTVNVSFTTETHFWFEYQGGEQFAFSGDDDTWVFVNKTLAVDLGGLARQTGWVVHPRCIQRDRRLEEQWLLLRWHDVQLDPR